MESNPNIQYELLAKELYEILHKAEGINTIDIQHNVKIQGRSGCEHQIDVYWEFEMVGQKHKIAIECKNYTHDIQIGRIRDFFGVVYDIGGINGIFITKKGYQSGAKKFADYYGISLQEMREPNDEDWEGRFKKFIFDITVYSNNIKKTNVVLNKEWSEKNGSVEAIDNTQFYELMDKMVLINETGDRITDVNELSNQLPSLLKKDKVELSDFTDLVHTFPFEDAFMIINGLKEKVDEITFTYDIISDQITSEAEFFAKAILKDVKSGEIKFFDEEGGVKLPKKP